ncbi:MAG: efflux RND transporter periplasmic adaptor subunit [Alphaproteobacteria bacterium]|nr:efflux RND transporter periplasmic adaptor subunit [Alphaproteobacteria bacterium]
MSDPKPLKNWRNIVFTGLAALAMLGLMGAGIGVLHWRANATPTAELPPPLSVATTVIRMEDGYKVRKRFAGRTEPARETRLSFERAGLVTAILFEEGERIEQGAVVARLDIEPLQVQRVRLLAQRRNVEAQLQLARLTTDRRRVLKDKGHSSVQRFDDARFSAAALAAEIDEIDAAVRALDIDITKSEVRAPFAGVAAERLVDEGAVVSSGTPILRLLETDRPVARIGISPDLAAHLSEGETYRLTINTRELEGRLTAVRPDLLTGTRTVTALFEISDHARLSFGEIVEVELERHAAQTGAWLPLTALVEGRKGLWTVFTVVDGPDGPVVAREAAEMLHVEADRAFVRGTFAAGSRVITDGTHRVIPGQRVALAQAGN